ncbi:MAG: TlpA family protein disulfide reductase [Bdellovibrionota bacterium]
MITTVLLVVVGIYFFVRAQHDEPSGPQSYFHEGDTLPGDLKFRTMEGKDVALSDYKGKVILINFWAGWCGPCLHEMPSIAALAKKLESKGFVVLAPVMDEVPQQGINVLKRVLPEIPFTVFSGLRSPISERFELDALPHSVLLDKNLTVQFSRAGEVNWDQSQAVKLVEGML